MVPRTQMGRRAPPTYVTLVTISTPSKQGNGQARLFMLAHPNGHRVRWSFCLSVEDHFHQQIWIIGEWSSHFVYTPFDGHGNGCLFGEEILNGWIQWWNGKMFKETLFWSIPSIWNRLRFLIRLSAVWWLCARAHVAGNWPATVNSVIDADIWWWRVEVQNLNFFFALKTILANHLNSIEFDKRDQSVFESKTVFFESMISFSIQNCILESIPASLNVEFHFLIQNCLFFEPEICGFEFLSAFFKFFTVFSNLYLQFWIQNFYFWVSNRILESITASVNVELCFRILKCIFEYLTLFSNP